MKFDPTKQYSDFLRVSDNPAHCPHIEQVAKNELQEQINSFIPAELRDGVKWITQHWPAGTMRVKDDNYEQLGLTESDIGKEIEFKESWTIAWKYTPSSMQRQSWASDKLSKADVQGATDGEADTARKAP